jgi:S-adenosylmethionine hydrolase
VIVLFTDFGARGPYVGQMRGVLEAHAPGVAVVELMCDAPAFSPRAASVLLAALAEPFPDGSVFLCVVDPGVGTARDPLFLRVDDCWYVGPDNGIFDQLAKRARSLEAWRIDWRPESLSESFHGRDLFAPVAARLARGERVAATRLDAYPRRLDEIPDDLWEVIYVDAFGNAITGVHAQSVDDAACLSLREQSLEFARTFGEAEPGAAFWYRNALGLVEIAVNQGSAAEVLGVRIGDSVEITAS